MATILDALTVSVGLDATLFKKGQKDVQDETAKTKARLIEGGKGIEETNKRMLDSFQLLKREVIAFGVALLGARGVKEFVADINSLNASLGYFSAAMGSSPQDISAFANATVALGGNADAAKGSIAGLANQMYEARQNGKAMSLEFYRLQNVFQRMTGQNFDMNHGPVALLKQMAIAAHELDRTGHGAQAFQYLTGAGVDAASAQAMISGKFGEELQKAAANAPSDEAVKSAQKLLTTWTEIQQTIGKIGSDVMPGLDTVLQPLLNDLQKWIELNKTKIDSTLIDGIGEVAGAFGKLKDRLAELDQFCREHIAPIIDSITDPKTGKFKYPLDDPNTYRPLWSPLEKSPLGHREGVDPDPLGELWKKFRSMFDIGAHAGELTPGQAGQLPARPYTPTPVPLTVEGRNISRGSPLPVDIVKDSRGPDSNSLLGGPMGSGSPLPGWSGRGGSYGTTHGDAGVRSVRGAAGLVSGQQGTLAKQAYDYWRAQGLTHEQAVGVIGDQRGENVLGSLAVGDGGRSAGQFQWDARRRGQILAGTGIDVTRAGFMDQQRAYRWEMENSPDAINRVWSQLKASKSRYDAVDLLVRKSERSANPDSDVAIRRGYADVYSKFLTPGAPTQLPSAVGGGSGPHAHLKIVDPSGLHTYPGPSEKAFPPQSMNMHTGAPLSTMAAEHPATTAATSNAFHINGGIYVNAPQAKDADQIGREIAAALRRATFANKANTGYA